MQEADKKKKKEPQGSTMSMNVAVKEKKSQTYARTLVCSRQEVVVEAGILDSPFTSFFLSSFLSVTQPSPSWWTTTIIEKEKMTRNALLSEVRQIIPPLSSELHKGQAGRVGIVGGSADYTGAPYFAAMASMRLGADMSHNICEPAAGDVIKTYSPDLIVHRILGKDRSLQEIRKDIDGVVARLHALAVGPGLGRDEHMQACAKAAMQAAMDKQIYLIVDADGLWLLQQEPDVVKGYKRCVLTPNVVEFGRLCQKLVSMTEFQRIENRVTDILV